MNKKNSLNKKNFNFEFVKLNFGIIGSGSSARAIGHNGRGSWCECWCSKNSKRADVASVFAKNRMSFFAEKLKKRNSFFLENVNELFKIRVLRKSAGSRLVRKKKLNFDQA